MLGHWFRSLFRFHQRPWTLHSTENRIRFVYVSAHSLCKVWEMFAKQVITMVTFFVKPFSIEIYFTTFCITSPVCLGHLLHFSVYDLLYFALLCWTYNGARQLCSTLSSSAAFPRCRLSTGCSCLAPPWLFRLKLSVSSFPRCSVWILIGVCVWIWQGFALSVSLCFVPEVLQNI